LSLALFGFYIFIFYAGAVFTNQLDSWNEGLSGLFLSPRYGGSVCIGIHFAMGTVILLLGCVQLVSSLRALYPSVHRWLGRIYVTACVLTGAGGLGFIMANGTIGGPAMDAGFALYGVLFIICPLQAVRYARSRAPGQLQLHRAWALRTFSLAVASWLYRMYYGFWILLTNGAGHTDTFDGPFDGFMDFFFYIPNLILVEVYLRAHAKQTTGIRVAAAVLLALASLFVVVGTYAFMSDIWVPGMSERVHG